MSLYKTNVRGTKLFLQDVVQKVAKPDSYGIVLRSWHDAEDLPPAPSADPLMRPLVYGEVGVTFLSSEEHREILPESELRLVDRSLQPGDYCKRSIDDLRAGVVTGIQVRGKLAHAVSAEKVDGWWNKDGLEDKVEAGVGDYVTFDDWIGQIIEVFDESLIHTSTNYLVRLPELGSRLAVGESGKDILPPPAAEMHKSLLRPEGDCGNDIVIAIKHSAYAVAWLALNQSLDVSIAAKKSRPKRFWTGDDIGNITLIRGRGDQELHIGDRVRIKNPTGYPTTRHGREDGSFGPVEVQTFVVCETSTDLDVLWQDGTKETVRSVDVIPYLNPDEYDCWPGDRVIWKDENESRPAIVQSVNAAERTSLIFSPDTGKTELASLLELDTHGNSDQGTSDLQHASFGVRIGDFVFIHAPGTTNGLETPKVPRIGEIEPWVRENPFRRGEFSGWRKELYEIGTAIASNKSNDWHAAERPIGRPTSNDGSFSWFGEVTGLNLDGTVEIAHPDRTRQSYPLERLSRLYDGIEQLQDTWDDTSDNDYFDSEEEEAWAMEEAEDIWVSNTFHDDSQIVAFPGALTNPGFQTVDDDDGMDVDDDSSMFVDDDSADAFKTASPTVSGPAQDDQTENSGSRISAESAITEVAAEAPHSPNDDFLHGIKWNRFEILSSAPPDHAFISSPPAEVSRPFLTRLNKEYRIFRSSLPDSIVVRAYEDRTDLLRSLIIGPENTPYQDAPFVIDWMLDSNFPQSPPKAHFLSWTNGNGRVNPNLYEEGKVCLSILGTWGGDQHEVWSATRSSLLQALVSIQGLVLVKEPWFCEPAYEKLRGTDEGIVNSRLYNEKAYVLSRGFLRRAMELPPGSLEPEITQLYYNENRLQKVVTDAEQLIQKSQANQEIDRTDYDVAVPRLSAGGTIALERTLAKLRPFLRDTT